MSGSRFVSPYAEYTDANGVPLAGALLFFYQTGTVTPQATYSNQGLTVPNANPVVADAEGVFPNIFLSSSPAYKVTLQDANGVEQWTADPVGPATFGGIPNFLVGVALFFTGNSIPSGAVALFGQRVSRTDFPLTFAALGTTWGSGDGTTNFNLPDMRGRGAAGVDNMGGAPANRLTSFSIGTAAVVGVGAGDQASQNHQHSITDAGHSHHINDAASQAGGGAAILVLVPSGTPADTSTDETGIIIDQALTGTQQNIPPIIVGYWIMYLA